MNTQTLNLIAGDGTPRTFTYAEIASHYANRQASHRRDWLESLSPETRERYIAQNDASSLEEDLLKIYDCDYHLMLNNQDECFDWATGKMGFHLSDEDQADYDVWQSDKHKLPSDNWRGYRALKVKRDAENAEFQKKMRTRLRNEAKR